MRPKSLLSTLMLVPILAAIALPAATPATFPGQAGQLAVVLRETGTPHSDIFTIDLATGEVDQLTDSPDQERMVRWSPDGRDLAYVVGNEEESKVVAVPHGGGGSTEIYSVPSPVWIAGVAWSPTGEELAVLVEAKAGLKVIQLVSADGTSSEMLVTYSSADGGGTIDWSPDGSLLAVDLVEPDGAAWVALLGLDGSPPVPLARGADPSWAPDGSAIVFLGEDGTSTINADGSDLRVVPGLEFSDPPGAGLGVGYYPVWSPAGEEIVVVSFQGVSADIVDVASGERRTVVAEPGWSVDRVDWQPIPNTTGFADVSPEHLFAADIGWLHANGLTKGCNPPDNTLFCPVRALSRAEAAAFLVRALDLPPAPPDTHRFTDVAATVFADDVEALAYAGIAKGCNPPDNTLFCPHRSLVRGEAAALLVRAFDIPPAPPDAVRFTDAVGSVFESDIDALANSKITLGCNPPANTLFCPDRDLTRGEAAALLHRAFLLGWLDISAGQQSS